MLDTANYHSQNVAEQNVPSVKRSNFSSISGLLFLLIIFLLPIMIIPGAVDLTYISKLGVVTLLSGLSLLTILFGILRTGEFQFPKSKLILALSLIPLSALISSLFSSSISGSIVGNVWEIGTAGSLMLAAILFYLSTFAGMSDSFIRRAVWVFLLSMGVNLLYVLVVTGMQSGWLPVASSWPSNLVGNYIDLSILLSVGIIISIYMLSVSVVGIVGKIYLWFFIPLSLLVIGASGFKPLIILLGIFSLMIYIYTFSLFRSYGSSWIKKSAPALVALVFTVIFIIGGTGVSGFLSNKLKINSFDVRPNVEATLSIMKKQWERNSITGSGPNRFTGLWAMYKPVEVYQSDFWNVNFLSGFGLIPTLAITTGILGLAAAAAFLFVLGKRGFEAFFFGEASQPKFLSVFTFLAASFFWIMTIIYIPNITVLSLSFIFTGLFVGTLLHLGIEGRIKLNILANPKTNFLSVFVVVVMIVGVIYGEYLVWKRIAASYTFSKAMVELDKSRDISKAQTALTRAVGLANIDAYERTLAELYLLDIERIAASIPADGNVTDEQRNELGEKVASAVHYANEAINADPANFQNYLTIGRIYESLAFKGIQGALENAKGAYTEALKYSPSDPSIQLSFARLSALSGNTEEAKEYIAKTLALKQNYTDAYFILAQLEALSNNVPGVIKAIESATLAQPTNAGLYFQLGLLKYNTGDNTGASQALERAVLIVPDYANAKYFLGLAYYNLDKTADAIRQFEDIKKTNPNSEEVDLILNNLKAGKGPFANVKPPLDDTPAKRKSPPIKED